MSVSSSGGGLTAVTASVAGGGNSCDSGGGGNGLFSGPMVQTISNHDGTVSIIQVDPNNPVIQLPDGTTAQVQGIAHVSTVNPRARQYFTNSLNCLNFTVFS